MVRESGKSFELTDEELLSVPAKMLDQVQRKRRRRLRKQKREAKYREVHPKRRIRATDPDPTRAYCPSITKRGTPCQAGVVGGAKHCMAHLDDADKAKLGIKGLQELGTEMRIVQAEGREKVSPMATGRQIMEVAQDKLFNRQLAAIGMELKGWDEEGHPVIADHGAEQGICLYGVSKDGDVTMSSYPDRGVQFGLIEKMFDRIYGKPKQTNVLEGGTKPVQIQPVRDVERAQKVAKMLHQVGAIPREHEGRRRAQPSEPSEQNSGDVVPLRPDDK